jgi:hypothetical protein
MLNIHERIIEAPADRVGRLLADLGGDKDRLWPSPAWVPMRLDRPLAVGADGGHGPIRYHAIVYQPGTRVRFDFHERTGAAGFHEFTVEPLGPNRCRLRHVLDVRLRGRMRLLMPLAIRSMHDAVLEDLLDNAEFVATGRVRTPATWSPWVRICRYLSGRTTVSAVPIPSESTLLDGIFDSIDLRDAWQVRLPPGLSDDPRAWSDAVFHHPPLWVVALFGVRNALVRLIGVAPEHDSDKAFRIEARTADEVLLGSDADHLDFRASVLVRDRRVTMSTVASAHNARGRLYLGVIRFAHPVVVRAMLRRAVHSMLRGTVTTAHGRSLTAVTVENLNESAPTV